MSIIKLVCDLISNSKKYNEALETSLEMYPFLRIFYIDEGKWKRFRAFDRSKMVATNNPQKWSNLREERFFETVRTMIEAIGTLEQTRLDMYKFVTRYGHCCGIALLDDLIPALDPIIPLKGDLVEFLHTITKIHGASFPDHYNIGVKGETKVLLSGTWTPTIPRVKINLFEFEKIIVDDTNLTLHRFEDVDNMCPKWGKFLPVPFNMSFPRRMVKSDDHWFSGVLYRAVDHWARGCFERKKFETFLMITQKRLNQNTFIFTNLPIDVLELICQSYVKK